MSRRFLPVAWAFTLLFLMMQASAQGASYLVAPFQVSGAQGYSYLGQALPSMLATRLYGKDGFEPVDRQDAAMKEKAPASRDAAAALGKKYGADYVVWGGVTVVGDQASIDVSALPPSGKVWRKSSSSPANALIGGLQGIADGIGVEVFGRQAAARSSYAPSGPAASGSAMNGSFVMNDSGARGAQGGTYLNPSLRYQGSADNVSQLRSQMLSFECYGMDVSDINGDGRSEVVMLNKNYVLAYEWRGGQLAKIGEQRVPSSMSPVLARCIKLGGRNYVVLTGYDENDRGAYSQLLEYSGGRFNVAVDHIHRYLNVVNLPPMYAPALIGQDSDRSKAVSGAVYECYLEGGRVQRGGKLSNLPKEASVFNFAWIPADKGKTGDHLALIAENETLLTFDGKGKRLAGTQDTYSGSSVYVVGDRGIGALEANVSESGYVMHYVPMRMPVVDLDRDGRWELLVNKPVTTAGKLFNNYRTYPQGEIHALLWDGMGMDLLWKTRRIKGTVNDVQVADINNDGRPELVVAVNSYGGMTNGLKTRCALYVYPLDQSRTNAKPNYQE